MDTRIHKRVSKHGRPSSTPSPDHFHFFLFFLSMLTPRSSFPLFLSLIFLSLFLACPSPRRSSIADEQEEEEEEKEGKKEQQQTTAPGTQTNQGCLPCIYHLKEGKTMQTQHKPNTRSTHNPTRGYSTPCIQYFIQGTKELTKKTPDASTLKALPHIVKMPSDSIKIAPKAVDPTLYVSASF